ncbi:ATP-binding cassette sub-family B member [Colletotrichum tofieldiae]|uniref:ATP-binding cassette sub-family B member n=1 Tax=Colletotrichum tofieldiae TaxID=708197 RepID=A0A166NSN3_9PEZI|nr:ATP-binding cassette sub-family B member [Colletotrichum tofieldiae]
MGIGNNESFLLGASYPPPKSYFLTKQLAPWIARRRRLRRNMLVLAHKISLAQNSDKIVVMDADQVLGGEKDHAQLMAMDGAYTRPVQARDLEQHRHKKDEPEGDELEVIE